MSFITKVKRNNKKQNIMVISAAKEKYTNTEDYNLYYYHEVKNLATIDYIIVEYKNVLNQVKELFDESQIILHPQYHDFNLKNIVTYYEFGQKHNDLSFVSNWCGGGYLYNWFNIQYNGPYVWGFFLDSDTYCNQIKDQTFFTEEIASFKRTYDDKPEVITTKGEHYVFNHYPDKSESEIIELHNKRRQRFNKEKIIYFTIAYSVEEIEKYLSLNVKGQIIFTSLKYDAKNVVSQPYFLLDAPWAKPNEHFRWIYKYMTKKYDLIKYIEKTLNGEDIDINDMEY